MTDLRKLLEDARSALYALGEKHYDNIAERIDAALAEKGEPVAIGEVKESGVVWANQNPHAYPIGTKFYTAPADQWRRVEDGLPDHKITVLCAAKRVVKGMYSYDGDKSHGHWIVDDPHPDNANVTHWMPLPALPEADK